jgi:phosphoribosyl 1,2-cyclic phosphodiesterase
LLSHLHWDHFQGLPFFVGGDRPDARVSLHVPDQGSGVDVMATLERAMSPPHFPIRPDQLRGEWKFLGVSPGVLEIEGFSVTAEEIPHKGGRTFGYRVSDDHSSITYMPDHCPTKLGPGADGWGEYHPAAMDLASGSDLLIHDAQLVAGELAAEASFGHAAAEYAVELGRRAGVRRVVLFHHKPDRTDDELDEIAARLAVASPVYVAAESMVSAL